MIYRVRTQRTTLDFGSSQAAYQLLDNYPPHVRESISVQEMTATEIRQAIDKLRADLSKLQSQESIHYQWLLSRIEFYSAELPNAEAIEQATTNKIASLPTVEGK